MKNTFIIIIVVSLFCSCGLYRYDYNARTDEIVSAKGNPITMVSIKDSIGFTGQTLAMFTAIENKPSETFSLSDFSPNNFVSDNYKFHFENNRTYYISTLPAGDRILLDIIIRVDENGRKKELKKIPD